MTVKIVILTVNPSMADVLRRQLEEAGYEVVTGPYVDVSVPEKIRQIEEAFRGQILRAGDIELNPVTKQVTRDSRIISLGDRPFRLLEFLMRNPDRMFEHKQLAQPVWNEPDVDRATIRSMVRHLRSALGDERPHRIIVTQKRRVGIRKKWS